ncbi:MAG TPA: DeoR/GlpR family DNA-binding transcription regulator [Protaetiibacter sp.]|nr:DeoR/GlpR family DNA-binding transcription regulator [Protaetiibacter sp.]
MDEQPATGTDLGLGRLVNLDGSPRKVARLEHIVTAVMASGFVSVDDLAEQLEVSRMTIHRDLDELQQMGVLRKVRGGASINRSTQHESDLHFRATTAVAEKKRIAAAAVELLNDGEVVIVDDSTTAGGVIPHLAKRPPMTVITNFVPAVNQLVGYPNVNLIGLGGQYEPRYAAFLGKLCEDALADLYADVLFCSTSSVRGTVLYHQDQRVVAVKRAMVRAANVRVLMVDHTKIGQGALYRLGDVEEFTHVVVDDAVTPEQRAALEERGVTVIVA